MHHILHCEHLNAGSHLRTKTSGVLVARTSLVVPYPILPSTTSHASICEATTRFTKTGTGVTL